MLLWILLLWIVWFVSYICASRSKTKVIKGPPGQKFFHEMAGRPHLDAQYGKPTVTNSDIIPELRFLLSELVKTCKCDFVLMYGGLIGWYFNGHLLPWDDDIDVIILQNGIKQFVKYDGMETSRWIIKVNPNYKNRNCNDVHNKIDARIISKQMGVFIDITFFWEDGSGYFKAKDGNVFRRNHILPLKRTLFEGQPVCVPGEVEKVLIHKYGSNVVQPSLVNKNWMFVDNVWKKFKKM